MTILIISRPFSKATSHELEGSRPRRRNCCREGQLQWGAAKDPERLLGLLLPEIQSDLRTAGIIGVHHDRYGGAAQWQERDKLGPVPLEQPGNREQIKPGEPAQGGSGSGNG